MNGDEPEEVSNINCIIDVPLDFEPEHRGLGYLYFSNMKKYKHKIAQYLADTNEEDTYQDLLKRSVRTALELKRRNITRDDIVMICSYNHKNSCIPFIASTFLRVPVASLDPTLSLMDTTHLMNEVKPKIIFVVPEALKLIETSLNETGVDAEIVVFGNSDAYAEFSDFLQSDEKEDNFIPESVTSLRETAVIFFSSGTTGLPKGIMTSHYALVCQTIMLKNCGMHANAVNLTYASLYWISAVLFLSVSILCGAGRVVCRYSNSKITWFLIEKYKVTSLALAPTLVSDLIKGGRPDGVDTSSLLSCVVGGGSVSATQMNQIRDLLPGTFVFLAYGQTEVAGILTIFQLNQVSHTLALHHKPESSGKPVAGIAYKVVDLETGKLCGPNEKGELRVKTDYVMNGYYGRDSSDSFDSDGWLRTGDIVYYDEEQCFFVVDRIKEMLKYKSWHVPPAMIEQIIVSHPAVNRAVVIGLPNEEDGDHPMALVMVNPMFNGDVHPEDIEIFVAERVPDRMKLRGGVKFIDSIPLTPSGKVKRRNIREMVQQGLI
ncbi:hypothetical protein NQ318_012318 [Aromia moschata]|uniref:Luciferin 4-monooxygenase n=1 Tax=Aromia moschata TaxID=1265417 RepID=A0AAV8YM47_9CUCU|nr:hypothetical protein NQ318_012318 [Aromia moschata]